jgi:HAMP domain-containing protein
MAEIKRGRPAVSAPRKRWFGLRFKMFSLFFFVPIILFIAASFLYLNYMKTLSNLITKESVQVVTKMAEESIAEISRSAAKEVERYLRSHPDLKREFFMDDPELKSIGMRKVGKTGYAVLVSAPSQTEPSALWLHPKQELIGKDIVAVMEKTLGDGYKRWFDIQDKAFKTGKESSGYYLWFDKREKYLVMVPVEGTPFFVSGTTYIDEFTLPMTELQARANKLTSTVTGIVMIVLVAAAILFALIVVIYSFRLSGRVKKLSAAADRISLGDVDFEIERIKSGDEIEDLANAFSRMQESIRLALKRLKERR